MRPIGIAGIIEHTIRSPTTLLKHRTHVHRVYILLDILRGLPATHEYAIVPCSYDDMLYSIAHDRQTEFIDYRAVLHVVTYHHITHSASR